jgi:chemotaxis protein MotB
MKQGTTGEEGGGPPVVEEDDTGEKERERMEETAQAISKAFNQDKLLEAFKDQISFDFTDEGLRIQIRDKLKQVLFDSGSARLKPYTMEILKEIGGHTDATAYPGKTYTNWELSADRANSARRVLESSGVRPGQVQRVTGYADSVPLDNKEPTDPQNRRISIVVMSSATEKAELERQKSKPPKAGKKP